ACTAPPGKATARSSCARSATRSTSNAIFGGRMSPHEEETLCRELVPRVRAFALRRTRDAALAADVAQEVTMIVIEALREGRVEDPSRLAAFALGVARNVVTSAQRGERRRSALLEQFAPTL